MAIFLGALVTVETTDLHPRRVVEVLGVSFVVVGRFMHVLAVRRDERLKKTGPSKP